MIYLSKAFRSTGKAHSLFNLKPTLQANTFHTFQSPFFRKQLFRLFSSDSFQKDLYKILGVPKSSSATDIKKAYMGLVKKYHPDVNKTAPPDKFKDINLAYSVLSNEEKRKEYNGYVDRKSSVNSGFGSAAAQNWGNTSSVGFI